MLLPEVFREYTPPAMLYYLSYTSDRAHTFRKLERINLPTKLEDISKEAVPPAVDLPLLAVMQKRFIRFITQRRDEDSGSKEGIFSAAYEQRHRADLSEFEEEYLSGLLLWFQEHLVVPYVLKEPKSRRAICWFREDADRMIREIWHLYSVP